MRYVPHEQWSNVYISVYGGEMFISPIGPNKLQLMGGSVSTPSYTCGTWSLSGVLLSWPVSGCWETCGWHHCECIHVLQSVEPLLLLHRLLLIGDMARLQIPDCPLFDYRRTSFIPSYRICSLANIQLLLCVFLQVATEDASLNCLTCDQHDFKHNRHHQEQRTNTHPE